MSVLRLKEWSLDDFRLMTRSVALSPTAILIGVASAAVDVWTLVALQVTLQLDGPRKFRQSGVGDA